MKLKMGEHAVQDYEAYKSMKHFSTLDGLRGVAVLMVLCVHSTDPIWKTLNGSLGVSLFFVLSGYLITTLLLREKERNGRVSFGQFYLRRAFRILPLYYVALTIFSILVLTFGLGSRPQEFSGRLINFLTFTNEFASGGTFGHSWTLGIEEKFYLVWPILMFVLPITRSRQLAAAALLVLVTGTLAFLPVTAYSGMYTALIVGALVALSMHRRKTFGIAAWLSKPAPSFAALLLTAFVLSISSDSKVQVFFPLTAAVTFPAIILGNSWISRTLNFRPIRRLGIISYAVYLFHPLCIEVVDRVLAPGQDNVLMQLLRLFLIICLSVAIAEVMNRSVEKPMIKLGRRIARTREWRVQAAMQQ